MRVPILLIDGKQRLVEILWSLLDEGVLDFEADFLGKLLCQLWRAHVLRSHAHLHLLLRPQYTHMGTNLEQIGPTALNLHEERSTLKGAEAEEEGLEMSKVVCNFFWGSGVRGR